MLKWLFLGFICFFMPCCGQYGALYLPPKEKIIHTPSKTTKSASSKIAATQEK